MEFDVTGRIIKSKIDYSKIKLSDFEIVKDKNHFHIKIKKAGVFLDWLLHIHSNIHCSGVFQSEDKAREFLIKTFLN